MGAQRRLRCPLEELKSLLLSEAKGERTRRAADAFLPDAVEHLRPGLASHPNRKTRSSGLSTA